MAGAQSKSRPTPADVAGACALCGRTPAVWEVCNGDIAKVDLICSVCKNDPAVKRVLQDPENKCPICRMNLLLPEPRKATVAFNALTALTAGIVAERMAAGFRSKVMAKRQKSVRILEAAGGGPGRQASSKSLRSTEAPRSTREDAMDAAGSDEARGLPAESLAVSTARKPRGTSFAYTDSATASPVAVRRSLQSFKSVRDLVAEAEGPTLRRAASLRRVPPLKRLREMDLAQLSAVPLEEQAGLWRPLERNRLASVLQHRLVDDSKPNAKQHRKRTILRKNLMNIIGDVFEKKIVADAIDDREENSERDPMPSFLVEYVSNQFGLRKLAEDQIMAILAAVNECQSTSKRAWVFGKLLGVIGHPREYTEHSSDCLMDILQCFFNAVEVQEQLDAMGGTFLVPMVEAKRVVKETLKDNEWFLLSHLNVACSLKHVRPPWSSKEKRAALSAKLSEFVVAETDMSRLLYGEGFELVNGDDVLHHLMVAWWEERARVLDALDAQLAVDLAASEERAANRMAHWEAQQKQHMSKTKDLTDVEKRNLVTGVRRFGNNWEAVLRSFQWSVPRNAPELERLWRAVGVTVHEEEDDAMDWTQWEWEPDWEWGGLVLKSDDEAALSDEEAAAGNAAHDGDGDMPYGMQGADGDLPESFAPPVVRRPTAGSHVLRDTNSAGAIGPKHSLRKLRGVKRSKGSTRSLRRARSRGRSAAAFGLPSRPQSREQGALKSRGSRGSLRDVQRAPQSRGGGGGGGAGSSRSPRPLSRATSGLSRSRRSLNSRGSSRRVDSTNGKKRASSSVDKEAAPAAEELPLEPASATSEITDDDSIYSDDDVVAMNVARAAAVRRLEFDNRKRAARLKLFERWVQAGTAGQAGTLGYGTISGAVDSKVMALRSFTALPGQRAASLKRAADKEAALESWRALVEMESGTAFAVQPFSPPGTTEGRARSQVIVDGPGFPMKEGGRLVPPSHLRTESRIGARLRGDASMSPRGGHSTFGGGAVTATAYAAGDGGAHALADSLAMRLSTLNPTEADDIAERVLHSGSDSDEFENVRYGYVEVAPDAWGSPLNARRTVDAAARRAATAAAAEARRKRPLLRRQPSRKGRPGSGSSMASSARSPQSAASPAATPPTVEVPIAKTMLASGKSGEGANYMPVGRLALRDNGIGKAGTEALVAALHGTKMLHTLDISDNRIGAAGAKALGDWIKAPSCSLRNLNLFGNLLGSRASSRLLTALASLPALHTLNIGRNEVATAAGLCKLLASPAAASLRGLDASWNIFRGVEGERLADALAGAPSLTVLNLEFCSLSDAAAVALARTIGNHVAIAEVGLRYNKIGEDGARAIAAALRQHRTVTFIDMACNFLGQAGVSALQDVIDERVGGAKHFTPATAATLAPDEPGETAAESRLDPLASPRRGNAESADGSDGALRGVGEQGAVLPPLWEAQVPLPDVMIDLTQCITTDVAAGVVPASTRLRDTQRALVRTAMSQQYRGNVAVPPTPIVNTATSPDRPSEHAGGANESRAARYASAT